mgnify:CR=1 FL=1
MGVRKGNKPWNFGLTKETDERIKKLAEKVSKTLTGTHWSQETRDKMPAIMRLAWGKPGVRERRSASLKIAQNRPEVKVKRSQSLKIALSSTEARKIKSDAGKLSQNRPEVKAKKSAIQKILKNDPIYKEEYSKKMKAVWSDPDRKEKIMISRRNPKSLERMSTSKIKNWQDPEYIRTQMKARSVKQNKVEKLLENILNKLYPNEYKFVGDGKVIIAGKCPDFININGQKKIIELFGDYWHRDEDPQNRIDVFKPSGYDTLIIWEHELKNIRRVQFRINRFHRMEHTL